MDVGKEFKNIFITIRSVEYYRRPCWEARIQLAHTPSPEEIYITMWQRLNGKYDVFVTPRQDKDRGYFFRNWMYNNTRHISANDNYERAREYFDMQVARLQKRSNFISSEITVSILDDKRASYDLVDL